MKTPTEIIKQQSDCDFCQVQDCMKLAFSKGLCSKHYTQKRRNKLPPTL